MSGTQLGFLHGVGSYPDHYGSWAVGVLVAVKDFGIR